MKWISTLLFVSLPLAAQDGMDGSKQQEAPEPPKPQKEHEWLKQFEGTWDFTTKWTINGQEMTGKGSQTSAIRCKGFWLIMDANEDKADGFQGHGIVGYDTFKKKFVAVWVDNEAAYLQSMTGSLGKDDKTLTLEGEAPGMDGKMAHWKWLFEIADKDHHSLTFLVTGEDKKEAKVGKIDYSRAKK